MTDDAPEPPSSPEKQGSPRLGGPMRFLWWILLIAVVVPAAVLYTCFSRDRASDDGATVSAQWLPLSPDGILWLRMYHGDCLGHGGWRVESRTKSKLLVSSGGDAAEGADGDRIVDIHPGFGTALTGSDIPPDSTVPKEHYLLSNEDHHWALMKSLYDTPHVDAVWFLMRVLAPATVSGGKVPEQHGKWLLSVEPWVTRGKSSEFDRLDAVWEAIASSECAVSEEALKQGIDRVNAELDRNGFQEDVPRRLLEDIRPQPNNPEWLNRSYDHGRFSTGVSALGQIGRICRSQYPSALWWSQNERLTRSLEYVDEREAVRDQFWPRKRSDRTK